MPTKVHHNTLLEVAWTIIPVIILVVIAIPSFKLLYFEADMPKPDVTIKAIGKQWFWTYEYPGAQAGFTFDSLGLSDADAAKAGKPRLLGVDNPDLCAGEQGGRDRHHRRRRDPFLGHAADGREDGRRARPHQPDLVQGDPDRHVLRPCSELCGARHAFMPIEVHVVSDADYAAWLATAKKKFAAIENDATRVAAK